MTCTISHPEVVVVVPVAKRWLGSKGKSYRTFSTSRGLGMDRNTTFLFKKLKKIIKIEKKKRNTPFELYTYHATLQ